MAWIDPNKVPKRVLANGKQIPCIGMGTFGSDRFTADQISNAVAGAIRCVCSTALPSTATKSRSARCLPRPSRKA